MNLKGILKTFAWTKISEYSIYKSILRDRKRNETLKAHKKRVCCAITLYFYFFCFTQMKCFLFHCLTNPIFWPSAQFKNK